MRRLETAAVMKGVERRKTITDAKPSMKCREQRTWITKSLVGGEYETMRIDCIQICDKTATSVRSEQYFLVRRHGVAVVGET